MRRAPMNRRAFLRHTLRGRERVLDLSCERLYMRWIDARARAADRGAADRGAAGTHAADTHAAGTDVAEVHSSGGSASVSPHGMPAWEGEPPLDVVAPTANELLTELERQLSGVHVLRVTGREWLASEDLGREVDSRIEAFVRRGGRVE